MVCKQEPAGAKPPLAGLVKIVLTYQSNATPSAKAANILHARWLSSTNHIAADLATAATTIATEWNNTVWSLMGGGWFFQGAMVDSLGGDGLEGTHGQNTAGGSGQVNFPPQAAVCISWKSGIVARGGRARTYVPGVPQSAVTTPNNAALTSAFTTSLKTQAVAFMNALDVATIGGDSLILGVPSYYHQCQLRTPPIFFSFFDALVHERLDSQRRRSGKEAIFPVM
jgi:hypothetical protein